MSKYVREIDSIQELRRTPTSDAAAAHVRTPTGQSGVFVPMDADPFGNGDDGAVALQASDGTWWVRKSAQTGDRLHLSELGASDGNNITDAVNRAISVAKRKNSEGGIEIVLPAGSFTLDNLDEWTDGVRIQGQGRDATTIDLGSSTIPRDDADKWRATAFKDIRFVGESARFERFSKITFERCRFSGIDIDFRSVIGLRVVHCDFNSKCTVTASETADTTFALNHSVFAQNIVNNGFLLDINGETVKHFYFRENWGERFNGFRDQMINIEFGPSTIGIYILDNRIKTKRVVLNATNQTARQVFVRGNTFKDIDEVFPAMELEGRFIESEFMNNKGGTGENADYFIETGALEAANNEGTVFFGNTSEANKTYRFPPRTLGEEAEFSAFSFKNGIRHDGTQVVSDRVNNADLGNTPNTGDGATDDLINALVDVITSHGLGRS